MDAAEMDPRGAEAELRAAVMLLRGLLGRCADDVVQLRLEPAAGAEAFNAVRDELLELAAKLDSFVALHVDHELAGLDAKSEAERRAEIAQIERTILSRAETLRRELSV